ncbi:MAG: class I SAM-dependent methyltransferase [Myxococcota bacterium]
MSQQEGKTGRTKTVSIEGQGDLRIREDEPLSWFEELYGASDTDGGGVPWASMQTHPLFAAWLGTLDLEGQGKSALVVGCGMGDDAIELEARGFDVTAFDVSPSAIAYCKKRFPESKVEFVQADLFDPPSPWKHHFDFVLEIYTVQAVPPSYEDAAIRNIAQFVARGGELLVIAVVGSDERSFDDGPPWLLTPGHVQSFASHGLHVAGQQIGESESGETASYTTSFRRP